MKDREIDRILSEEEILPSSGFTASVMDAVRREAEAPLPIPFPWRRALLGLVAAALTLAPIPILILFHPDWLAGTSSPAPAWFPELGNNTLVLLSTSEWRSVELALLATFFSLVVPIRLVLRKG